MARPIGIQRMLGGRPAPRVRRRVNSSTTAMSTSQKSWPTSHCSIAAQTAVAMGNSAASTTCQSAGGGVPVRRGMTVKSSPTARQVRKPSSSASGWRKDR